MRKVTTLLASITLFEQRSSTSKRTSCKLETRALRNISRVNSLIKAILFDLGGTLVYDDSGEELVGRAYQNVAKYLNIMGHDVTGDEFARILLEVREELRRNLVDEYLDLDMLYAYWTALKRLGITPTLPLVKGCIEAYYIVRASKVKFFPEVESVLKHIKECNYKTAIVSNTNVGFDYVVANLNLRNYFDVLVASYRVTRRKPHPLIFAKTLEFLKVCSGEALMVGDSLNADVLGAKKFGMKVIWIVRGDVNVDEMLGRVEVKPDAVIKSLDELFDVIS